MQLVPALCNGTTIRLFSGFEPERFLDQMHADRVTHTFLVPTMIHMLLEQQERRYRTASTTVAFDLPLDR